MILTGIGKRYAVALFNIALKEDIGEQVRGDIESFATVYRTNSNFRNFLESPQVLTEEKKELLLNVIGERASGLFVRFVILLLEKKRIEYIQEIAEAYTFMWEDSQGVIEVKVVTAIDLDHELELKTRQTIEAKTGKKVRVTKVTNPDIVGGMILFTKDRVVDGSIRHQLQLLRKELSQLKVH